MKGVLYLCVLLAIIAAMAAGDQPSESARTAADGSTANSAAGLRSVRASSGRCVALEKEAAIAEAEKKANDTLLIELGKLAEELGAQLSASKLIRELSWLCSQPGVARNDEHTVEEQPYGPVAEYSIVIRIPDSVLAQWASRLAAQRRMYTVSLLTGAVATLVAWLMGGVLVVILDRATGGYYRPMLLAVSLVGLVSSSVIGWVWLISAL